VNPSHDDRDTLRADIGASAAFLFAKSRISIPRARYVAFIKPTIDSPGPLGGLPVRRVSIQSVSCMAEKATCTLRLASPVCFKVMRGESADGDQQVQQEAHAKQVSGGFAGK
jgi:hypothetical protein